MKLKTKLTLAFGFLFVLILLLGGVGSYYLRWLAQDSRAIIRENYRTLHYMQNIESSLGELLVQLPKSWQEGAQNGREITATLATIEENLALQQENITESGERQLTQKLVQEYSSLKQYLGKMSSSPDRRAFFLDQVLPQLQALEAQADRIYSVNEETLLRKNDKANQTADTVTTYMNIVGIVAFTLALLFLIRIPEFISRPIQRFNEGIQEISQGNYTVQLNVGSNDEFGSLARSFNTMAAKLEEYEHSNYASIISEKRRMDAVINQLHEPVIGLNENKVIIFINQHALDLLGLKKEQVVGRYAPDIAVTNPLLNSLIGQLMIGSSTESDSEDSQLKVVLRNKEKLFSKSIIDILDQPAGEDRKVLIGHVIFLTDITAFSEKDKAKTHFMATLSHELKTPMAAIQMSANLLHNPKVGELNGEQLSLIQTIEENNQRVQRMITEILDISKIESGIVEVVKITSSPNALIEKALEGVRPFLKDKQILIENLLKADLPGIVVDPHKLVWVLNNFLTNAIRYTPFGEKISINAYREERFIRVEVQDKGPGISPENQRKIFKRFFRIADDKSEGTGLGLAISQEFVQAMGGEIGVNSRLGEGSTFWVRLPMDLKNHVDPLPAESLHRLT